MDATEIYIHRRKYKIQQWTKEMWENCSSRLPLKSEEDRCKLCEDLSLKVWTSHLSCVELYKCIYNLPGDFFTVHW